MSQQTLEKAFSAFNLPSRLVGLLAEHEIVTPTPIQEAAIPVGLEGTDLIGIAQTGTGKTLAFALPMAARLGKKEIGLVIAPTRELAQQIAETFAKLQIRTALIVGGASYQIQSRDLKRDPRVIVATPGRLIDHLERRTIRLNLCSMVVLDEADRMFDMGFAPAIKRILNATPVARQTMLFSATMPPEIEDLAAHHLVAPERIEIAPQGTSSDLVEQELVYLEHEEKRAALSSLLDNSQGPVLVFARTKHGARKLAKSLYDEGHTAAEIHAARTLAQRREALAGFKSGKYRILVATDIAARGIDVKEIALVVNFDIPENPEDYVHRIGRTGRNGATGRAVTFVLRAQERIVKLIERLLDDSIAISPMSTSIPRYKNPDASPKNPYRDQRFKSPGNKPQDKRTDERGQNRPQPFAQEAPARKPRRPHSGAQHQDRQAPADQARPAQDRPTGDRPKPSGKGWVERTAPQGDSRPHNSRPPQGPKSHRGWSGKPKKRRQK